MTHIKSFFFFTSSLCFAILGHSACIVSLRDIILQGKGKLKDLKIYQSLHGHLTDVATIEPDMHTDLFLKALLKVQKHLVIMNHAHGSAATRPGSSSFTGKSNSKSSVTQVTITLLKLIDVNLTLFVTSVYCIGLN